MTTRTEQFDLVCVSHLWWDWVWQRPQQLMSRFARRRRVFWTEEPHIEIGEPSEAFEVTEELPGLQAGRLVLRSDEATFRERLREVLVRTGGKDFTLPTHIREASLLFGSPAQPRLEREVRDFVSGWRRQPLVLWLYTPLVEAFVDLLRPDLVVYDVMDELSAFQFAPASLKEQERRLLQRADLVFAGGPSMHASRTDLRPDVHLFPSGVEQEHFARALDEATPLPEPMRALPGPVIGFFGVIDERADLELLAAVADLRPTWSWVMIGPVLKIEEAALPRRPNIHYLGRQDYQDLPGFLKGFDVAMLPFARNEATRFISPTKTLEYMAAQRPIVSTPIPDVIDLYGEVVRIAETPEAFVAAADAALAEDASARERRRAKEQTLLQRYAWDTIADEMEALIVDRLGRRLAQRKVGDAEQR
jgi:glycosyltransferase involved in cell wall biosynthesis